MSTTPITDKLDFEESCNYEVCWSDAHRALERHANELREQLDRARFLLTPFDKWTGVSDFLAKPIPTFTAP